MVSNIGQQITNIIFWLPAGSIHIELDYVWLFSNLELSLHDIDETRSA